MIIHLYMHVYDDSREQSAQRRPGGRDPLHSARSSPLHQDVTGDLASQAVQWNVRDDETSFYIFLLSIPSFSFSLSSAGFWCCFQVQRCHALCVSSSLVDLVSRKVKSFGRLDETWRMRKARWRMMLIVLPWKWKRGTSNQGVFIHCKLDCWMMVNVPTATTQIHAMRWEFGSWSQCSGVRHKCSLVEADDTVVSIIFPWQTEAPDTDDEDDEAQNAADAESRSSVRCLIKFNKFVAASVFGEGIWLQLCQATSCFGTSATEVFCASETIGGRTTPHCSHSGSIRFIIACWTRLASWSVGAKGCCIIHDRSLGWSFATLCCRLLGFGAGWCSTSAAWLSAVVLRSPSSASQYLAAKVLGWLCVCHFASSF